MPESFNMKEARNTHTWFMKLLLSSDRTELRKIVDQKGFDSSKMNIELKINGMEVRSEDFSELLDKWSDDVERWTKEKHDMIVKEKSIECHAEELLKKKMGKVYDLLNTIEEESYKIYE